MSDVILDPIVITPKDLTNGVASVSGDGVFDLLMQGFKAHLRAEYDASRITGAEYTKAYIACTEAAMSNAVQFLLSKDNAYWQAVSTKFQAEVAKLEAETARYTIDNMLPLQKALTQSQVDTATYNLVNLLPLQKRLNETQVDQSLAQIEQTKSQTKLTDQQELLAEQQILNAKEQILLTEQQIEQSKQQVLLTKEQVETQRSQTMDTRSDGTVVAGSTGKQKDLYNQQIISYQRDAEVKAAKIFSDAWITMKTMDEGLLPPDNFTNTSLNEILAKLKVNNAI